MHRPFSCAVFIVLALFNVGPFVLPSTVAAEVPNEAEVSTLDTNEASSRGTVDYESARQEAVSGIVEKLLLENFRTELKAKLQGIVLRAEKDQAHARQNLNAAETQERQFAEALELAEASPPDQDLDLPLVKEELASIRINIEHLAKNTFDALARVNGFSGVLEELTEFDLLVAREEEEAALLQRFRSELRGYQTSVSSSAIELADRLYALGIMDSFYPSESASPSSSSGVNVADGTAVNELRTDWITGTNVYLPQGDNIGSIIDIVADGDTGELKAAIMEVGGFLGISQKQIALPWAELTINSDAQEITANLTREEADAAPEYVFRGYDDTLAANDGMPANPAEDPTMTTGENEVRIDWITGTTVRSPDGADLGSISDVILDGDTGELKAAIVGTGGFLGIGQRDIVLPWAELTINSDAQEITADLTREEAEAAPEYVFRGDDDTLAANDGMPADPAEDPAMTTGENDAAGTPDDIDDDAVLSGDPERDSSVIDPMAFMPELFPWPPPEASARATINRRLFGVDPPQNLGEVADALQEALADAGYTSLGYLGVPGGFAIVTRIEQHDNSGRPLPGNSRWATQTVVVKSFSIYGIIRALMTTEPGFFRVLVLVVTDKPFSNSRPRDRLEVLERWSRQGLNALVPIVREMPFSANYRVTALVYEFEKGSEGEDPLAQVPGRREAAGHLAHTRFYQFLR